MKPKTGTGLYRRLLKEASPYKKRIFAALICMIISSACTVFPPWLLKNVVDDVLIAKNMMILNFLSTGLVLIYIIKAFASYGQQYLMNWVGQKIVMNLRARLYERVQRMSLKYIYGNRVGDLMSRITNDANILQNMVTNVLVDLVVQGVTFIGMLGFMIYLNWKLTVITFIILPLVALLLSRASKRLRTVGHDIQEQLAMLSAIVQEALSAIRIVLSFATEEQESRRFRQQNQANFKALMRRTQVQAALTGVIEVVLISALALILWIGGRDVVRGNSTPGELIAFLGYLAFLVQPVRVYTRVISGMQHGLASCDRIYTLLDAPLEVKEPENPFVINRMKGRVDFEDVWFSYEENQWILKGIDLSVKPGEKIAIVGPTGVGKSTLMDFIPRFYDPQGGIVRVDGRDVRTLQLSSLRRQIGIVPQDPVLMRGTIAFNIAYGLEDAGIEDIRNAAKIAGIDDFIESLPEKYNTAVGERGVTLSGGQRQRVAIARAIIRDPRILIMDEATSSLDIQVEKQIQQAMKKAMEGRTSFVIAHRLTTIRDADRIVVLSEGRISEMGDHNALLAKNGIYSRLYNLQFGEVHEKPDKKLP